MDSAENTGGGKRPRGRLFCFYFVFRLKIKNWVCLGRPPKHKTRSLVEAFAPKKTTQTAGETPEPSTNGTGTNAASRKHTSTDTTNNATKPTESDKPTTTRKRSHAEFKEADDSTMTNTTSTNKPANKNLVLPQRRSSRQTTVMATQVSEGTLRPPGPPHLEAALNIALRNLESATWGFLWSYNEKHQGKKPLPTPSEIKALSKSVKRASELADKADRELEEAIDEIMLSNARKKRRGPILSKYVVDRLFDTDSSASSTPVIRRTPCQD